MALLLSPADHSQWRMKLNNFPYFPTRNAEGFGAAKAFKPVPSTGKPDPALIEAFLKEYPEARKSIEQKAKMPLTGSFSGAEFYVVNALYCGHPMDKNSQSVGLCVLIQNLLV